MIWKGKEGKRLYTVVVASLLAVMVLAGCAQSAPASPGSGSKLKVVATTTLVGDVVEAIGGDAIELAVLLPVGADPHAFEPTPQDMARVADAAVVFANGAGLEAFLDRLLANAGGNAEIVRVSEGITLRDFAGEDDHAHGGKDPHVWTDPNHVMVWTRNIEDVLSRLDGAHAAHYQANAEAYRGKLGDLDTWVRTEVAQIPESNRKLVTDHMAFGYFADRYGFEQIGAVVPGYSTVAQPSAQEIADLEDRIREYDVKAVFVGDTVNPALARRVAEDTGIKLVFLYTGSLTAPGGDASTYLDYVRYNVSAIVGALK
jgi:ABC-type Zn uptake system ZnuABC Zn-binding protein ZnuA